MGSEGGVYLQCAREGSVGGRCSISLQMQTWFHKIIVILDNESPAPLVINKHCAGFNTIPPSPSYLFPLPSPSPSYFFPSYLFPLPSPSPPISFPLSSPFPSHLLSLPISFPLPSPFPSHLSPPISFPLPSPSPSYLLSLPIFPLPSPFPSHLHLCAHAGSVVHTLVQRGVLLNKGMEGEAHSRQRVPGTTPSQGGEEGGAAL